MARDALGKKEGACGCVVEGLGREVSSSEVVRWDEVGVAMQLAEDGVASRLNEARGWMRWRPGPDKAGRQPRGKS